MGVLADHRADDDLPFADRDPDSRDPDGYDPDGFDPDGFDPGRDDLDGRGPDDRHSDGRAFADDDRDGASGGWPADGDPADWSPGDADDDPLEERPEDDGAGRDDGRGLLEWLTPAQLRADFADHFQAHYQRLVAQLYAITLNPAEAHDVVREAYSRAWRKWAQVGACPDPAGWVRRVAVRSTMRSWRRLAARVAPARRRRALVEVGEPRTRAMLLALGRLPDAERRAAVLVDMAGMPVVEVAALEHVPPGTVAARLSRARQVVGGALAEVDDAAPVSYDAYPQGAYAQGDDW